MSEVLTKQAWKGLFHLKHTHVFQVEILIILHRIRNYFALYFVKHSQY